MGRAGSRNSWGLRWPMGAFMCQLFPTVAVYDGAQRRATPSASAAISAVVNGASYLGGVVSPGELVSIFGANLGASSGASGVVLKQWLLPEHHQQHAGPVRRNGCAPVVRLIRPDKRRRAVRSCRPDHESSGRESRPNRRVHHRSSASRVTHNVAIDGSGGGRGRSSIRMAA